MYGFYGWEADVRDRNGLTPKDWYDLLGGVWRADTCAPRMRERWAPENPTLGQCSITAFLAQELFGGQVRGVPLGDGNFHCFNVVEGRAFDLTSEQFGERLLDYERCPEQFSQVHFAKAEKRLRYLLLRRRFLAEYCVKLKHTGRNCCQAVLCAYAESPEEAALLMRVGAGFGGGMGCMESTCGSLCAAQMALGLRRFEGRPMARDARALVQAFRQKSGATICRELKGIDTGRVLCACDDCVRNAVTALEELLYGPV